MTSHHVEVLQMNGKASVKLYEAIALWDIIQKDHNTINWLLPIIQELKDHTNTLGWIEVLRERLHSMDLQINELQMRLSTHILEDHLVRLEDKLNNHHEEIAILQGQVCYYGQQGNLLMTLHFIRGLSIV